jgi:hypothetical protein
MAFGTAGRFAAVAWVSLAALACAPRRDVVHVGPAPVSAQEGARSCGRAIGKLGHVTLGGAESRERTRVVDALECAARTAREVPPLALAPSIVAAAGDASAPAPETTCESTSQCYDGFRPSGDALADVRLLGERCGRACGMAARSKVYDVEAPDDSAPLVLGIDLDDATCYRIFAVSGDGIGVLRAAIVDADGYAVSIDNSRDRAPMLGPRDPFCPSRGGHFRLVVAPERGAGRYALQMWSRPRD